MMIVIIIQILSIIFIIICKKKINTNHQLNNDERNNFVS